MTTSLRQGAAQTLDRLRQMRDDPGQVDSWLGVALLYGGAVVQMMQCSPAGSQIAIQLPSMSGLREQEEASAGYKKAFDEIRELAKNILAETKDLAQGEQSDYGAEVVALLGRPLYDRLHNLLIRDPFCRDDRELGLFTITLGDRQFRLVLSHSKAGQPDLEPEEPLRTFLPPNGWHYASGTVIPPLVRLLPFASEQPPNIVYLNKVNPEADNRLCCLTKKQGLRVAAMGLHRDLAFRSETLSVNRDGQDIFRIVEPDSWPKGWDDHLRELVRECGRREIAIAALPELSVSPMVMEVIREAMAKNTNGFPLLVAAGSWHLDQPANGFVNRLTILSGPAAMSRRPILVHDKFEPYIEHNFREGNTPGKCGLSFLVTSIGIIALGICKDWFVQRSSGTPLAMEQITYLRPAVVIAPAMTNSMYDLENTATSIFKQTGTVMVTANSCGTMRDLMREKACCLEQPGKRWDIRSFVAASDKWYVLEGLNSGPVNKDKGVLFCRAPCGGSRSSNKGNNTVFALVRPKM